MESSDSSPFDSLKSKKILHSSSSIPKPSDQMTKAHSDTSPWSSKTPEKPANRPRRILPKEVKSTSSKLRQQIGSGPVDTRIDGSINLPQKYETLGKLFDSLDSSIRLLKMKGSMSTFSNISPKVECLTDRRFSYFHLAQLKFILPEVIEIKKVLVHDEPTCCMKPDLYITMNVDAINNDGKLKSASGNLHMRDVFRSRLLNFYRAHPEGEVPEGMLPEPFNQSKTDLQRSKTKASSQSLLGEALTDAFSEQQPVAVSHLSQSFQKHFSQVSRYEAANSNQEQSKVSLQPPVLPVSELYVDQSSYEQQTSASDPPSICNFSLKLTNPRKGSLVGASQASSVPLSHLPASPMKERDYVKNEASSFTETATIQGTPAKLALTPVKLMCTTPALQPPKRCYMSPDNDSTSSPNKFVSCPPCNRSLKFDTPVKNSKVEDEVNYIEELSFHNDIFEILPENLLESIREKERKTLKEQDPAISAAKRRQQMISSLPKLFDTVHYLFQSIKRSVITKEELMHKITVCQLDVVDRREVEEQLELLQELVPEWIHEKSVSSGDLLICINKILSPESMRAKLVHGS